MEALSAGELSASRPSRFTPGENVPGTHWRGRTVAILDDLEKRKFLTLPGLERLRHPCFSLTSGIKLKFAPSFSRRIVVSYDGNLKNNSGNENDRR
jgi:hypothetical protein